MEAVQHLWIDQEENGVTLESIPKTMQEKKTLASCSFYSTERGCNKDIKPKSLRCFQSNSIACRKKSTNELYVSQLVNIIHLLAR